MSTTIDVAGTETFSVSGMTCSHCVHAVSTEIGRIAGVASVQVDLATGRVTVASAAALDRDEVAAAVAEAGYTLTA